MLRRAHDQWYAPRSMSGRIEEADRLERLIDQWIKGLRDLRLAIRAGAKLPTDDQGRVILNYWPDRCPICHSLIDGGFEGRSGDSRTGKWRTILGCTNGHRLYIDGAKAGPRTINSAKSSFYRPGNAPIKPAGLASVPTANFRPDRCAVIGCFSPEWVRGTRETGRITLLECGQGHKLLAPTGKCGPECDREALIAAIIALTGGK